MNNNTPVYAGKVFVYYNLHTRKWSVKALEGQHRGRVIAHCTGISLKDVVPRVSEKVRQRVIRQKVKEVHAGLVGHVQVVADPTYRYDVVFAPTSDETRMNAFYRAEEVTYNPYKYSTFVFRDSIETALIFCKYAFLTAKKQVLCADCLTTAL